MKTKLLGLRFEWQCLRIVLPKLVGLRPTGLTGLVPLMGGGRGQSTALVCRMLFLQRVPFGPCQILCEESAWIYKWPGLD